MQLEDLAQAVKNAERLMELIKDIEEMQKPTAEPFIPVSMEDRLLTVADVAKRLQTGEPNVRNLMKKGFLPYLIVGDKKIRESTLIKFMAENEGCNTNGEEIKKISEKEMNKAC